MSKIKNIKLVGFASIGVIGLLGIGLVGMPLIGQTARWSDEEKVIQEQNQKVEDQVVALKKIQSNTDAVSALNDELNKKFPATANVPLLLSDISLAAANSGISANNITAINIKNPELYVAPVTTTSKTDTSSKDASSAKSTAAPEPSKLATMRVEVSVIGTPQALSDFLKNLGKIDRAIKVDTTTIALTSDKNSGNEQTMTIAGTTLLYAGLEVPTADSAKTTSGSTKVTPTPAPSATTKK